ncbi:MAG: hypothetical protein ACI3YZ_00365 [Prevotella sp.]
MTISNTLLMMLIILTPIIKDSTTVANILEDCPIADKMPVNAWKVNKGISDGVD